MAAAGMSPRWDQEALRMIAAGLLGSVTLPAFMYLSRRFPVAHPHLRRNAMVHLASALGLATALVVVSHVLANSLFEASHRLTMGGLRDDLAANELLLLVGLIALSGIAHLIRSPFTSPSSATSRQPPASVGQESGRSAADFREAVPGAALIEAVDIKVRGVTKRVPIEDIDWIEAQGNYLALHIGGSAFLVRETLARFQTLLDSARFIRIHRRTIVALDRITGVEPAVNGDKVVRLRDNHTLRVSRLYRNALDGRLGATIIASTEGHLIQQSET
jgi:DNA-binding LytR/AlgR family response regulator